MSGTEGFAILNRHEGGVKSGLAYYVRNRGGGLTYDFGNQTQDLYGGSEYSFSYGSHLRMINDQEICIDTDSVTFRNSAETTSFMTVTDNANGTETQIKYHLPNDATKTLTYGLNDAGDLSIVGNGVKYIVKENLISLNTTNANSSINISDSDSVTRTYLGGYYGIGQRTVNVGNLSGDPTKSVPINVAGYNIDMLGTVGANIVSSGDFNVTGSNYADVYLSGDIGTDANNTAINLGAGAAYLVLWGTSVPVSLKGADLNATNGGVAVPATGPLVTVSNEIFWTPVNYTSPTAGALSGKILMAR